MTEPFKVRLAEGLAPDAAGKGALGGQLRQ